MLLHLADRDLTAGVLLLRQRNRIPLRLRQWRRRLLLLLRAVHTLARRGRAGVPSLFYALQQVTEPLHDLPVDVVHGADLSVPGAVNAEEIFLKRLNKMVLTKEEELKFKTAFMLFVGKEYHTRRAASGCCATRRRAA